MPAYPPQLLGAEAGEAPAAAPPAPPAAAPNPNPWHPAIVLPGVWSVLDIAPLRVLSAILASVDAMPRAKQSLAGVHNC